MKRRETAGELSLKFADRISIANVIRSHKYSFCSEKELQEGIERVFRENNIGAEREFRLGDAGVIDFFHAGIGVEIKTKGSLSSVLRQLARYTKRDEITGLVLVTTRNQLRKMPLALNGKEISVVYIGGIA